MNELPSSQQSMNKLNLLIGVTGSVATIKLNQLIQLFHPLFNIKVILTKNSSHFLKGEGQLTHTFVEVYDDEREWTEWGKREDPVLHIELRKWADCFLIAPLSANSLAKISNGIADNLLTLVCRCWNMKKKEDGMLKNPLFVCPAMNSMMWDHPITEKQLQILREWGYTVMDTVEKKLICGDYGKGAMMGVENIFSIVKQGVKKQ